MDSRSSAPFRVGAFRVDPRKNVLERKGFRVRVEPKAMRVLVHLAIRAGEDVSREEILQAVWEGSRAGADVLTNAIWELRKAFGDDPREPEFIQTVSRKGYRLVAPVDWREPWALSVWLRALVGRLKGESMRKGTPFALVLCSAVSAFAQTARVGGRITDSQGGILPGVTVTMTQVDTGLSSETVTNASGSYHFPALDPGGYHLEIRLAGFAPWTRRELVLSVGQGITIDATLELAGLTEAITVTGDSPMISNRESKVGGVVESEQIENIPINSRDVQQLALLVPGAKRANSFDPTKSIVPAISFGTNGSGRGILYTLDQGDNTDDVVGGIVQRRLPGLGAPPGGERASVDGGLQRGSRRKRDVRRLHRGSEWRATGTGELQERSHGDSRPPRHRVLPHGGERNLQITFEAFNLFNRVNRGLNFTETFESPNVGEWTQGLETNQAQLQLGIRFQF